MKSSISVGATRALRSLAMFGAWAVLAATGAAAQDFKATLIQKSTHSERLTAALASNGHVRVIVRHQTTSPLHAAGSVLTADMAQRADVAQAVGVAQNDLVATHIGGDREKAAKWATRQISHFPLIAMTVTAAELQKLAADSRVVEIWEDQLSAPSLDQSVPLIGMTGATGAYSLAGDGTGTAVAVLDTGVQSSHPFLAGKVVDEACFSTTSAGNNSTTVCPNGLSSQSGVGAGVNCDVAISNGCAHGTHVAGIVAGKNAAGAPTNGVAKEAKIIAVQVFSKFTGTTCGASATATTTCVLSYSSDQIAGLNYVLSKVGVLSQTIASVNMSLGGGQYSAACDSASQKPAIDALKAANVATVIAAGNNGFTSSISSPGCISTAIAVGATNKTDLVSYYSNVSSLIKVFAPGSSIQSSIAQLGGGSGYSYYNGTSMATPHVAGAFAAIRSRMPAATVDEITNALVSTGKPITDTIRDNNSAGGGTTKPRIRVDMALSSLVGKAVMQTPANGSTLTSATQTFTWTPGTNVSQYWLALGTTVGGTNLYNGSAGTSVSLAVSVPANGQPLYARLWSQIGGYWVYNDYNYTTVTAAKAVMTAPANGSTLTGTSAPFSWTTGSGTSEYWLDVGYTAGGTDVFTQSVGTALSATVSGLAVDGRTVYVRLWSKLATWVYNDYTYTATTNLAGTKAVMSSPANAATLTGASQAFSWTAGTNATEYWLYIGNAAGATDLYNQSIGTSLTTTVSSLPTDGRALYVRLFSKIAGVWAFNDYTYTAVTISAGTKAVMSSPANGATLAAASQAFSWSTGTNVTQYWLYVGNSTGASEYYNQSTGTSVSTTVSGLPTDGRALYVRLFSLIAGAWVYNDYSYTAVTISAGTKAVMSSPTPGAAFAGASQAFSWTPGTNVTQYWLYAGNTVGASEYFNQSTGTSVSTTVTGLPNNGRAIYVRLFSQIAGAWLYNDYTYTASVVVGTKAAMITPAAGTKLSSSTTLFNWNAGVNVSEYWLSIGNAFGTTDIYDGSNGIIQSKTVIGLPTDGRTLYVRLFSKIGSTWQSNDYIYSAVGAPSVKAAIYTPVNGARLTYSTAFYWTSGTNVGEYWFSLGSTPGGADYFDQSMGTSVGIQLTGFPSDGRTYYVRFWSKIGITWQYNDTVYYGPLPGTSLGVGEVAQQQPVRLTAAPR